MIITKNPVTQKMQLKRIKMSLILCQKDIGFPYNITQFYFNLVYDDGNYKTDDNFKEKTNKSPDEVQKHKPFFENIEILETFKKEEDGYTLTYQKVKYKDFNGTYQTKAIKIGRINKTNLKRGPYYDERKYGSEYKKCGKLY